MQSASGKPRHRMYLNLLKMTLLLRQLLVEPRHRMYLNIHLILVQLSLFLVEPRHRMYLNMAINGLPAYTSICRTKTQDVFKFGRYKSSRYYNRSRTKTQDVFKFKLPLNLCESFSVEPRHRMYLNLFSHPRRFKCILQNQDIGCI